MAYRRQFSIFLFKKFSFLDLTSLVFVLRIPEVMLQVQLQRSLKILPEQRNLQLRLVKKNLSQRPRQDSLLTYKVRDGEIHWNRLLLSSSLSSSSCIGLTRPKFELTNQDSAGGKSLLC